MMLAAQQDLAEILDRFQFLVVIGKQRLGRRVAGTYGFSSGRPVVAAHSQKPGSLFSTLL